MGSKKGVVNDQNFQDKDEERNLHEKGRRVNGQLKKREGLQKEEKQMIKRVKTKRKEGVYSLQLGRTSSK